ncbi:sporozoite surface protein 2, partial [Biomphalaria pfeifferi]
SVTELDLVCFVAVRTSQEPVKKMFRAAVFFAVLAVAFCAAYNKVDTKAYSASSAKDYSGNQAGSNYNGYQAGSNSYNNYDQGYNPCGYGDNGKRLAIRDFCAGYFECQNGEARYYECDEYKGFDIYNKKCVPDKSCATVCPKGFSPSFLNNINTFYLDGKLMTCPYDTFFNTRICTCDHISNLEYQQYSSNQYNKGKQYDNNGKQYDNYGKQYDNSGKQYDNSGKQYKTGSYNNAQYNGNYASQYQAPKSADSYAKTY